MKYITILGSTGSIGTQTLDVVRANPQRLKVCAIAAGSNTEALEKQVEEFFPELVCVYDKEKAEELQKRLAGKKVTVVSGMEGMILCATCEKVDIVVASVVGMIGIRPVTEAIKAGKDIAFANKETLVTAGHIIMPLVKEYGVSLLPVDSEHAAVFQCLNGENIKQAEKIILTASGGPFRGMTKEELEKVQLEDALRHPNWSMGKKITIDSSTMANKALEVIEAKWLFDMPVEKIEIVIQPQSLIHSMVEFADGAIMAQLGTPDMRLPIQYALFYPERYPLAGERVDFADIRQITFEKPDYGLFPMLRLGLEAGRMGGSMPTVFNAANEKAVDLFLKRQISYPRIARIVENAMLRHQVLQNPSLEDILQVEREVHQQIAEEV